MAKRKKGKTIDNSPDSTSLDNVAAPDPTRPSRKWWVATILLVTIPIAYWLYSKHLTIDKLIEGETTLRNLYSEFPIRFLSVAFLVYVLAIGMSLPISAILSLTYAWLLGWVAVPLLLVAATTGATIAFFSARYLFRDWVQNRFRSVLIPINRGFQKDGAFYIYSMRMIALFPFFVVNLVLGLVPVKWQTYVFATILGMFPLTIAFVYAGMQIPSMEMIKQNGITGIFSMKLVAGFAALGTIPLLLRWLISVRSKRSKEFTNDESSG